MIRFLAISTFVGFTLLVACRHEKPKQNIADTMTKIVKVDTLKYSYQTVREQADDCKSNENCSYAEIKYPVFDRQVKLNDSLQRRLIHLISFRDDSSAKADSVKEAVQEFLSLYYKSKKEGVEPPAAFTLDAYATVLSQNANLIVIEIGEVNYSGGAHENGLNFFINWDIGSEQTIGLKDIFIDGYQPKLTKIVEGIFRMSEHLTNTASLQDYLFTDGKFVLNNNFYIGPSGISFFYNNYEIKPYSEGPTILLIPYIKIKHLLRPNTVVSQYIK